MITIEAERRVSAPVDAVWATVSAIDRYPAVVASYVRVEYLTAQTAGVGTRWRQTRRVFDREHAQELNVVSWEPPAFLVTVSREAGATHRTTWRLVPDDDGTMTTLRFEIDATNVFGRLVQRLLGGRLSASTRDAMERDLADLARAAEQAKGR